MKICSVEKYKGSTFCVEFCSGERVYLDSGIVSDYNLKADMDIPEQALAEVVTANDTRRARERALYLLSSRDFSYKELFEKLEQNYDEEVCYTICNRMAELGLINDQRYAEKLARTLFEVKRVGMYKAKQEMRLKGLSDELIGQAVSEYEESTADRLEELVDKKYARYLTDDKGVKKVKSALTRLGYSYGDINAVLELYDLDFDEFDEDE